MEEAVSDLIDKQIKLISDLQRVATRGTAAEKNNETQALLNATQGLRELQVIAATLKK